MDVGFEVRVRTEACTSPLHVSRLWFLMILAVLVWTLDATCSTYI